MEIDNVLLVYLKASSREHNLTLKTVEHVLTKYKIRYTKCLRSKLCARDFKKAKFVMVVGGDGTFLRASHYTKETTHILGINSDPKKKEGFFTRADRLDFEKKLKRLLKGNFTTCKLNRLRVTIDGKTIPEPALNEVFIGDYKPYNISNYIIHLEGKKEKQRSSGIIIGTAAGSHAWVRSAGGKVLPLESKDYQLIVREPYAGRLSKHRTTNKTINSRCCIKITSLMKNGTVVIDSLSKEYSFKTGDKLTVKRGPPLTFICFGKTEWIGLKRKK